MKDKKIKELENKLKIFEERKARLEKTIKILLEIKMINEEQRILKEEINLLKLCS